MGYIDPDWKPSRPEEAPTLDFNVIPPFDDLGWAGQAVAEAAYEELQAEFAEFQLIQAQDSRGANVNLWDAAVAVNGGQHLSTWAQLTGDCVSMGAVNVIDYVAANEIYRNGDAEVLRRAFPPFIYSAARVLVGGGRLRGAGAVGAWAAVVAQRYGTLAKDAPGVPQYSKAVAETWGNRSPSPAILAAAKPQVFKSVARIRTYEDVRDAVANYYGCTFASSWVPSTGAKLADGVLWGVGQFSRKSGHQMAFIAVNDAARRPRVYVINSWGSGAHGKPQNGEPPGGFWIDADLVNKILAQNDSFVFSQFNGFPGQPRLNFNVIA